jgi:indolepyruvate ferredoxin oxidoreductase, beta subunit
MQTAAVLNMPSEPHLERPLSIAICALGGQGGGVLADWIVHVAERFGWLVQLTSVPGVAQRTGTTVYYLETCPPAPDGQAPIFALMPVPGDVDVVVAAELMEAGRAVVRGFVSPERTTTIASTHRVYGITEKSALGDGMADPAAVMAALKAESRRLLCFDMEAVSAATDSVISSVLLGALAASGALPFPRELYVAAIREGGVSESSSLRGFTAGFEQAMKGAPEGTGLTTATPEPRSEAGRRLTQQVCGEYPAHLQSLIVEGVKRLMDYQDMAYAELYLDRLAQVLRWDGAAGGLRRSFALTGAVARYLALWMSYEDTIRVADLKTRRQRFERFRGEVQASSEQIVYVTEFMHPRYRELCETLPAGLGKRLAQSRVGERVLGRFFQRGRHIDTATLAGFLPLYGLAALRRWRRGTWRYRLEQERIEAWLERIRASSSAYDLAVEIAECQRLIKGYGDTHERGLGNYERIMQWVDRERARVDLATSVRRLRSAALLDERGEAFNTALGELRVTSG